jgi:phosphoribosylglycinamide formyltransferase-1
MSAQYNLPRIASIDVPLKIGVLISGSGSGLEALLRFQQSNNCSHTTAVVISDKANVKGLERATNYGIKSLAITLPPLRYFSSPTERRIAHENLISKSLDEHQVELVVCSGYMRILTENFLNQRLGRVINIHPSPWGEDGALYPGAHGIQDTIEAGSLVAGASVHFVSAGVDDGPLIATKTTEILTGEDEQSLGLRIRIDIEHKLYPLVIDALAEGRVLQDGNNFKIID